MKVLVTGGTGFIGGNVARALHARDYEVRALIRQSSSTLTLENTGIETVLGDIRDRESVASAIKGCQAVVHAAALYTFWTPEPRLMYEINEAGTRIILEEALKAGVQRCVYTSTVSTVGIPKGGVGNEEFEPAPKDMISHYKKSKYKAEKVALDMARNGLPVVVVNPTAPIGPWDVKPTPTGGIVVDFLRGRMPAYISTGMNVVDVEDVAVGHILAMEKGRPGQRYLLGNRNMTLKELLTGLGRITGQRAPWLRVPLWLAIGAGYIDRFIEGGLLGKRPIIPLDGLRVSKKPMYVSCEKSVRELGLPQSPVEGALEKAVTWFREYGYVN